MPPAREAVKDPGERGVGGQQRRGAPHVGLGRVRAAPITALREIAKVCRERPRQLAVAGSADMLKQVPLLVDGELVVDIGWAPARNSDEYRTVLRDAYLLTNGWLPGHVDGRAEMADNTARLTHARRGHAHPGPTRHPSAARPSSAMCSSLPSAPV